MEDTREAPIRLIPRKFRPQLAGVLARVHEEDPGSAAQDFSATKPQAEVEVELLSVHRIKPSRYQSREFVNEKELEELTHSIKSRGILQPVIVRPLIDDGGIYSYELVAGERRLRAAKNAGLELIPAIVRSLSNRDALEIAIIENAQREDLNPIEEAISYQRLTTEFNASQTEIAEAVGKNRATISNSLRLLQLEPEVMEMLRDGTLSAGHGRALLAVKTPELQISLARRVERHGLAVRTLEQLVTEIEDGRSEKARKADEHDVTLGRVESRLKNLLEIERLSLRFDHKGRRRLQITFDNNAAWKRFIGKMRG